MTTTGDMIYESSPTTAARLPIGSTGQVLTVSGGIPTWATPSTGGGQVIQAQTTTSATSTSSTYISSNISASITPSSSSKKVLVTICFQIDTGTSDGIYGGVRVNRGSTIIFSADRMARYSINSFYNGTQCCTITYLDSPATTSAVTYSMTFARLFFSSSYYGSFTINNANFPGTIILQEV